MTVAFALVCMYVSVTNSNNFAFTNPCRFILPDFPNTTKWLSDEERAIASFRLREHSGTQDEERGSLLKGLWMAITDYKVWILAYVIIPMFLIQIRSDINVGLSL